MTTSTRPWPDDVRETVASLTETLRGVGLAAVQVEWQPTFEHGTGATPATWLCTALAANDELVAGWATSAEANGHRQAARLAMVRCYGEALRQTGGTAHVEGWRWPGRGRRKACSAALALLAEAGLPDRPVLYHGGAGTIPHRPTADCWCRPTPVAPATRKAGER